MAASGPPEGGPDSQLEAGSEPSHGAGSGPGISGPREARSRGPQRFGREHGPSRAVIALYAGVAAVCLLSWAGYALWRGHALVAGLVFTTLFALAPFVLIAEGLRYAGARQWGQGAIALCCGLFLLGYAASGQLVRGVLFPGDPLPVPAKLPKHLTRVEYAASDGQPLVGILARAAEADAPLIVLFHGNGESAARNVFLAQALRERGCHVFVGEFRGYGGVGGSPTQTGLLLDGEAAIETACARLELPAENIVLCGRSLGSGVASALAARGLGRKLVLLSPYTSITDVAAQLAPRPLAWLAVRDPLDSRAALATRPELPVLVFHGDRDQVVPYGLGQELAASLGARGELVTLAGIGHNDLLSGAAGERVLTRLVEFARAP